MKKIFESFLAVMAAGSMLAAVTPHYEIIAGYDHLDRFHYTTPATYYNRSDNSMDGFHVGANVQLDFMEGKHVPSLIVGLNYQFLASNHYGYANGYWKAFKAQMEAMLLPEGVSNYKLSNLTTVHTFQIPILAQYTYNINDNWKIMAFTGPMIRLHVSERNDAEQTFEYKGQKYGSKTMSDVISNKCKSTTWAAGEKSTTSGDLYESKDECAPVFDMAWNIGVGFGYKFVNFKLSYEVGMCNMNTKAAKDAAKAADGKDILNDNVLALTLGFRLK